MGWQFDRIRHELPILVFWIVLAILIIWISVVAGGVGGEWSIATAFGQMALGSLAVLVAVRYLV